MREYTILNPTLTVREDDEVPREWSTDREREKEKGERNKRKKREKKERDSYFSHKNRNFTHYVLTP